MPANKCSSPHTTKKNEQKKAKGKDHLKMEKRAGM
jgi:hypothetical protein